MKALASLVLGLFVACGSDREVRSDAGPLDVSRDVDFARITPSAPFDRWELRLGGIFASEPYEVIARGGVAPQSDLTPSTEAAFRSMTSEAGFEPGCPPGYCYRYLVTLLNDDVRVLASTEALATFLAPVDNIDDALFIAKAHGYMWQNPPYAGPPRVRRVTGGYELEIYDLWLCPLVSFRTKVHVDTNGALTELERTRLREHGGCV